MKSFTLRLVSSVLALAALLVLAGAASKSSKSANVLQPDKLIILSTTDVKGKTSPCG